MKTSLELSKFTISLEEDENGVVKMTVSKADNTPVDEIVYDADEYEESSKPPAESEVAGEPLATASGEEMGGDTPPIDDGTGAGGSEESTPESEVDVEVQEQKVAECLTFEQYFAKKK